MKTIIITTLIIFCISICYAQDNTTPDLIPYRKGDKWGYCNKDKEIIISCKYELAERFDEELAMVIMNDKWGFIDNQGREVIPIIYDIVWGEFREGFVKVEKDGKQGLVDMFGMEITNFKYDCVYDFSEGLAAVMLNDKWGFIDKKGEEIISLIYDHGSYFYNGLAQVSLNEKDGFIDKDGRVVIPFKYDAINYEFSEGLVAVKTGGIIEGKWGYINKEGKVVIPFKYYFAVYFKEGLAAVCLNDKYGFIDKEGREVIPLKYKEINFEFSEGLAAVCLNDKWGYIDKNGKVVIPFKYNNAWGFNEGLAKVMINNKYGFIDKTGREVIPLKYDEINWEFSEGLAAVCINEKCGFIDKEGREVIPLIYTSTFPYINGIAEVCSFGYGYVDKNGTEYWEKDITHDYFTSKKEEAYDYYESEKYDRAYELLKEIIESRYFENNDEIDYVGILFKAGFSSLELRKYNEVIFYFEEVLKIDSNHYLANNNLGVAYQRIGNDNEALLYYKKAFDINPKKELAKNNLEKLEKRIKQYDNFLGKWIRTTHKIYGEEFINTNYGTITIYKNGTFEMLDVIKNKVNYTTSGIWKCDDKMIYFFGTKEDSIPHMEYIDGKLILFTSFAYIEYEKE